MATTNITINRWAPVIFTMAFMLHPRHVSATEDFIVNPFDKQVLRQLNWRDFPTKQLLKHFKDYLGENREKSRWQFIYGRKIVSEFGKTNEFIQRKRKNGNEIFRLLINSLDDTIPRKCYKARKKIERAIGVAKTYVDTSYSTKVLVDKKSKATFDWHTTLIKAQWFVGNTSLQLNCLGFGTDKDTSKNALMLIIEEKTKAHELRPIIWLVCSLRGTIRFNDGTERPSKFSELVFGVDSNDNDILREDNSRIDNAATITESSIRFKLGKKGETAATFQINRFTGSITGERTIKKASISAVANWNGSCEKLNKAKKKF